MILKSVDDKLEVQAQVKRYDLLLEAVDILSQQIDIEQIYQVSIELFKGLLDADFCYLYTKLDSGKLQMFKSLLYKDVAQEHKTLAITEKLKGYALLNAGLITNELKIGELFDKDVIEALKPIIVVPLIVKNKIEGVILLPRHRNGQDYTSEDISSIFALMKLLNSSLERYGKFIEIKEADKSIEDNTFKLKALNYSSKVFLKELMLDDLYKIAVDTFLEISGGNQTVFFVYDDSSEEYKMKANKISDERSENSSSYSLTLDKATKVKSNRIVLDINNENDKKYFNSLFQSLGDMLSHFSTRYVILIANDADITGFVTLGDKKNGEQYNKGLLEVIEALATNTYFAIRNANYFGKESAISPNSEKRYGRLMELNQLMKNINGAESIETVVDRISQTFLMSYKVKKYIIAIFDKAANKFNIKTTSIPKLDNKRFEAGSAWENIFNGEKVVKYSKNDINIYLPTIKEAIGEDVTGIAIIPVAINKTKEGFYGAIIVFEQNNFSFVNNELLLYVESIATHMAPIIKGINSANGLEVVSNDDIK